MINKKNDFLFQLSIVQIINAKNLDDFKYIADFVVTNWENGYINSIQLDLLSDMIINFYHAAIDQNLPDYRVWLKLLYK